MPNHVHVIVVPFDEDGLRRTFADAHRRYTGFVNARHRWTGHLWQGRFGAVVMDEPHLGHALRYVSLNPVRARLVEQPQDWRWSSVRAHLAAGTTGGSRWCRRWSDMATSPPSWAMRPARPIPGARCGDPKTRAARWGATPGLRLSRRGRGGSSPPRNEGPSREMRLFRKVAP